MITLVFEDEFSLNFLPLSYTRPIYELRCGAYTLVERAASSAKGSRLALACRAYLAALTRRARPGVPVNDVDALDDDVLLVNGRAVPLKLSLAELAARGVAWVKDGDLVACLLKEGEVREAWSLIVGGGGLLPKLKELGFELREVEGVEVLKHPWQLIALSPELLSVDLLRMPRGGGGVVEEGALVKGDRGLLVVEEGASVEAFSLIDLRRGPVFIGRGSVVEAGSRVVGPAYIGRDVVVRGARVGEGCVIGDSCRVGGEVEATVMQGYVNKQHGGFLGHSYVGAWVNLAAATTNSDLKNTYGTVRVSTPKGRLDTGMLKLGCFIGDHVKTSIGTMIYAGVKVGVCSHLHGFIARDVPCFTIWAESLGRRPVELRLDSALETARRMEARRGVELSVEEAEVLREVFNASRGEREGAGVARGEFKLRA
jgi:UDP-N-acetylglucosamine diphosphorylase/glucosamine-1-phosphate N-acetyltransferase